MSLASHLKEANERVAELNAANETMTAQVAEMESTIATMQAEHAAKVADMQSAIDAKVTELAQAGESLKTASASIETLTAEKTEAEAECAKLQRALEDPAFRAAKATGEDPVSDGGEASAPVSHIKALESITDPKERNAYYKAHKAEIKAEMKG
jgi:chromosome segregation ATPase